MSTSQQVKLRKGQHEAAVGIHIQIRLALRNSSIPIAMQTIKPVLSIAVDLIYAVCGCSGARAPHLQKREAVEESPP